MAISKLPIGSKLLIGDGRDPETFRQFGEECLKFYEPSPGLLQLMEDTERMKKDIREMSRIPIEFLKGAGK